MRPSTTASSSCSSSSSPSVPREARELGSCGGGAAREERPPLAGRRRLPTSASRRSATWRRSSLALLAAAAAPALASLAVALATGGFSTAARLATFAGPRGEVLLRRPSASFSVGGGSRSSQKSLLPRRIIREEMDHVFLEDVREKEPEPRIKVRRRKAWQIWPNGTAVLLGENGIRKDSRNRKSIPERKEMEPSDNPMELMRQIELAKKYEDLLPFLEDAVQTPSFRMMHVRASVQGLAEMKRFGPKVWKKINFEDNLAIELLAMRGGQQLLKHGGLLTPKQVADLWYNMATVAEDMPILCENMAPRLAKMVLQMEPIFEGPEDTRIVQGMALLFKWLGRNDPEIRAKIIGAFITNEERLEKTKAWLRRNRKTEQQFFKATLAINKQDPSQQLPLYPGPRRHPRFGDQLRIGTRFTKSGTEMR